MKLAERMSYKTEVTLDENEDIRITQTDEFVGDTNTVVMSYAQLQDLFIEMEAYFTGEY